MRRREHTLAGLPALHAEPREAPALEGLPSVGDVDMLPDTVLAPLALYLSTLQSRIALRLVSRGATPSAVSAPGDVLLSVERAAARLGVSRHWLYRNAATLPFTRRLSSRALRFSSQGIDRWLRTQP